jgi:hypothetical protein
MGVERYEGSFGFGNSCISAQRLARLNRIAILIESQNCWPRTEGLLIGLHTTPNGRGGFHFLRQT